MSGLDSPVNGGGDDGIVHEVLVGDGDTVSFRADVEGDDGLLLDFPFQYCCNRFWTWHCRFFLRFQ